MRSILVAAALLVGASLAGCSSSDDAAPSITLTPSGTVQVSGPTEFTATLVNVSGDVAWTVDKGALSSTSGLHVTYTPPQGSSMATLNASIAGMQVSVQIASSLAPLTAKTIPGLSAQVTVQYDPQ